MVTRGMFWKRGNQLFFAFWSFRQSTHFDAARVGCQDLNWLAQARFDTVQRITDHDFSGDEFLLERALWLAAAPLADGIAGSPEA